MFLIRSNIMFVDTRIISENYSLAREPPGELLNQINHLNFVQGTIQFSNQCRLEITKFDVMREQRILEANNLGAFYRFVNKKLSSKSGIAPLKDLNGNFKFSDLDKAELLNQYVVSVFTVDDGNCPTFHSRLSPSSPGINDINTSPSAVRRVLGNLKINSAAGPDQIPSLFYRKAAASLCFPLSILFPLACWFAWHSLRMEAFNCHTNF